MKLAFFDDYKLGVVVGDKIVDVSAVAKGIKALGPQDVIRGVIENFGKLKGKLAVANAKHLIRTIGADHKGGLLQDTPTYHAFLDRVRSLPPPPRPPAGPDVGAGG